MFAGGLGAGRAPSRDGAGRLPGGGGCAIFLSTGEKQGSRLGHAPRPRRRLALRCRLALRPQHAERGGSKRRQACCYMQSPSEMPWEAVASSLPAASLLEDRLKQAKHQQGLLSTSLGSSVTHRVAIDDIPPRCSWRRRAIQSSAIPATCSMLYVAYLSALSFRIWRRECCSHSNGSEAGTPGARAS